MKDRNEVAEINTFRAVTGLVGLLLFLLIAVALFLNRVDRSPDPFSLILAATTMVGWGGLVYACWIRSGRITGTALVFVLSVGVCGMAISHLAFGFSFNPIWLVALTGTWILSGLGIVWLVQKVRRIRAALNTDAGDAAR